MAWLAVDKNGDETMFRFRPCRYDSECIWTDSLAYIEIPKGTIKKIIGKDLTWDDEPVELI